MTGTSQYLTIFAILMKAVAWNIIAKISDSNTKSYMNAMQF